MVLTAFKPLKESTVSTALLPQVWTMEGIHACLEQLDVFHFMKNSLVVSFSVLILQYLVIIPAAYAFARVKFPGRGLLFGVVLLGFMIPQQVTFVPVYLIFSQAKLLQSYWPQILPFVANAFGIFLLRQYFMQIPEEIIESARMDNASELKIILRIMIPMSKTALFTIGLLSFISSWNSYFWPLIMTTKNTYRPLAVGVAMLRSVDAGIEWNKLMAGNLFLAGPILIAYFFASKQIRKAFVYSGIK
jgi:sn-glycerol 3-phosphate transport system permease protein